LKALCYAGGVALNSTANGRLVREGPFEEVFIQPAAGDAGAALGAALYVYHVAQGQLGGGSMVRADLGANLEPDAIRRLLTDCQIPHERIEEESRLLDRVASLLIEGQIVGWAQGRFEWGPRALGQRSILADPRSLAMKDRVNRTVKFREPFRPFAPSVLAEEADELFELSRGGARAAS
jgi:carbamoyltransferase